MPKISKIINTVKDNPRLIIGGLFIELAYLSLIPIELLRRRWGDEGVTLTNVTLHGYVEITLLFCFAIYAYLSSRIKKSSQTKKIILSFSMLFVLTGFISYPLGSNDIFSYISTSRIVVVHEQNPYAVSYDDFKHDVLYEDVATIWSSHTSSYGPLFIKISSLVSSIAGGNLLLNIYLFKTITLLSLFLSIFLVGKISGKPLPLFLYSWNPLVIFVFAFDAHNDIILILPMLLSMFYLFNKKTGQGFFSTKLLAWLFFVLALLVKYYGVILAPFFLWESVKKFKGFANKITYGLWFILAGTLLATAVFSPYWIGLETFSRTAFDAKLSSPVMPLGKLVFAMILMSTIGTIPDDLLQSLGRISFSIICLPIVYLLITNRKDSKEAIFWKWGVVYSAFFMFFVDWWLPWYFALGIVLFSLSAGSKVYEKLSKSMIFILTFFSLLFLIVFR